MDTGNNPRWSRLAGADEAVLTLTMGESGKIRFLLPSDMWGQLGQALRKLAH
jgi:hypothetical protein